MLQCSLIFNSKTNYFRMDHIYKDRSFYLPIYLILDTTELTSLNQPVSSLQPLRNLARSSTQCTNKDCKTPNSELEIRQTDSLELRKYYRNYFRNMYEELCDSFENDDDVADHGDDQLSSAISLHSFSEVVLEFDCCDDDDSDLTTSASTTATGVFSNRKNRWNRFWCGIAKMTCFS